LKIIGNLSYGDFCFEIPLGDNNIYLEKEITYEYKKGVFVAEVRKKPEEENLNF